MVMTGYSIMADEGNFQFLTDDDIWKKGIEVKILILNVMSE